MGAAEETEAFAALLRELKERSGLSYEVLSRRTHMSASTLHRYCRGEGVPADYAPVERFARVCKGSADELVELHRRWVVASAARERDRRAAAAAQAREQEGEDRGRDQPAEEQAPAAPDGGTGAGRVPAYGAVPVADSARDAERGTQAEPGTDTEPDADTDPDADVDADVDAEQELMPVPSARTGSPEAGRRALRRRRALIAAAAAAAVAAVAVSTAVAVNSGGEDGSADGRRPATASSHARDRASDSPAARSRSARPSPSASKATSSAPPSRSATAGQDPAASGKPDGSGGGADAGGSGGAAPLTVASRAHAWDYPPCGVSYLVDRPPSAMPPPPPTQQQAARWVDAFGAVGVGEGEQRVALTIQGTSEETVVIESLAVTVVRRSAPPAWNVYAMADGCGGQVHTTSFDLDLDAGQPVAVPQGGQADLPLSVSKSDPEVVYLSPRTSSSDVSWYVDIQWSSGGRQAVTRVDDHGKPFRTASGGDRPYYVYPNGASEWTESLDSPLD